MMRISIIIGTHIRFPMILYGTAQLTQYIARYTVKRWRIVSHLGCFAAAWYLRNRSSLETNSYWTSLSRVLKEFIINEDNHPIQHHIKVHFWKKTTANNSQFIYAVNFLSLFKTTIFFSCSIYFCCCFLCRIFSRYGDNKLHNSTII